MFTIVQGFIDRMAEHRVRVPVAVAVSIGIATAALTALPGSWEVAQAATCSGSTGGTAPSSVIINLACFSKLSGDTQATIMLTKTTATNQLEVLVTTDGPSSGGSSPAGPLCGADVAFTLTTPAPPAGAPAANSQLLTVTKGQTTGATGSASVTAKTPRPLVSGACPQTGDDGHAAVSLKLGNLPGVYTVTVTSGSLSPVTYSVTAKDRCDVDLNGPVNPVDALTTLRIFAGLQSSTFVGQGDADANNVVNPVDALRVLRVFAGLELICTL